MTWLSRGPFVIVALYLVAAILMSTPAVISCLRQNGRCCSWNQATWRLAGQLFFMIDDIPSLYFWFLHKTKKHEIDGDPRDWSSGLSVIFKTSRLVQAARATIHTIQFYTRVHFPSHQRKLGWVVHSFPWCWRLLKERLTATGRTTTTIRRRSCAKTCARTGMNKRGAALGWSESICGWFQRISSCSKVDNTYRASCIRIYQHAILN